MEERKITVESIHGPWYPPDIYKDLYWESGSRIMIHGTRIIAHILCEEANEYLERLLRKRAHRIC